MNFFFDEKDQMNFNKVSRCFRRTETDMKPKIQKYTVVMLHNLAPGILPPPEHWEANHCLVLSLSSLD
jgi:hypothetical protein